MGGDRSAFRLLRGDPGKGGEVSRKTRWEESIEINLIRSKYQYTSILAYIDSGWEYCRLMGIL